jgi:hypothetical protein
MRRCTLTALLAVSLAAPLTACSDSSTDTATSAWATKSAGRDVMIKLTPKGVEDGLLTVAVRVDTHSGDLANLDLKKAARLVVGDKEVVPTQVPILTGHHAGGDFVFPVDAPPERFVITLSGVRGEAELRFSWP